MSERNFDESHYDNARRFMIRMLWQMPEKQGWSVIIELFKRGLVKSVKDHGIIYM